MDCDVVMTHPQTNKHCKVLALIHNKVKCGHNVQRIKTNIQYNLTASKHATMPSDTLLGLLHLSKNKYVLVVPQM